MKTTLQKLINKWEIETGSYIPNAPIYKAFIEEAKMFLNDEKEQIKESYREGKYHNTIGNNDFDSDEDYYDSTFGDSNEAGI